MLLLRESLVFQFNEIGIDIGNAVSGEIYNWFVPVLLVKGNELASIMVASIRIFEPGLNFMAHAEKLVIKVIQQYAVIIPGADPCAGIILGDELLFSHVPNANFR